MHSSKDATSGASRPAEILPDKVKEANTTAEGIAPHFSGTWILYHLSTKC
jgi:hypothetical protein